MINAIQACVVVVLGVLGAVLFVTLYVVLYAAIIAICLLPFAVAIKLLLLLF